MIVDMDRVQVTIAKRAIELEIARRKQTKEENLIDAMILEARIEELSQVLRIIDNHITTNKSLCQNQP